MWKNWSVPLPHDVGVVVVAAGRGTRFGGPLPKQYQLLARTPVLLHAIRAFATHPQVGGIVVVVPPDDAATPPAWLADACGERLRLVAGGSTRRDSVRAGLAALAGDCTIVLVHDGARPFPARATIDAAIACARDGRAAVPAIPVSDTIKRADEFGRILSTVDRHGLWAAQTPQAFPRAILERAHAAPGLDDLPATDDATLVERLGEPVDLIPGSIENLKITTAHDLELATWYASRR